MKKYVLAAAAAIAMATTAYGADLSVRSPAPMYRAAPTFTWTGLYIGANAGGGIVNHIIDDKDCTLSCSSQHLSASGFTVGGTIGYNWQFGPAVVGIEADFNWIDSKAELVDPDWPSVHRAEWNWFTTVRGRAGVAVDRALIYATGGVAFVDVDVLGSNPSDGSCTTDCLRLRDTLTGLAAGFGAEYAFAGPWSAKAEYLFVALPSENSIHNPGSGCGGFTYCQFNYKADAHVVRVGVNYKLF